MGNDVVRGVYSFRRCRVGGLLVGLLAGVLMSSDACALMMWDPLSTAWTVEKGVVTALESQAVRAGGAASADFLISGWLENMVVSDGSNRVVRTAIQVASPVSKAKIIAGVVLGAGMLAYSVWKPEIDQFLAERGLLWDQLTGKIAKYDPASAAYVATTAGQAVDGNMEFYWSGIRFIGVLMPSKATAQAAGGTNCSDSGFSAYTSAQGGWSTAYWGQCYQAPWNGNIVNGYVSNLIYAKTTGLVEANPNRAMIPLTAAELEQAIADGLAAGSAAAAKIVAGAMGTAAPHINNIYNQWPSAVDTTAKNGFTESDLKKMASAVNTSVTEAQKNAQDAKGATDPAVRPAQGSLSQAEVQEAVKGALDQSAHDSYKDPGEWVDPVIPDGPEKKSLTQEALTQYQTMRSSNPIMALLPNLVPQLEGETPVFYASSGGGGPYRMARLQAGETVAEIPYDVAFDFSPYEGMLDAFGLMVFAICVVKWVLYLFE